MLPDCRAQWDENLRSGQTARHSRMLHCPVRLHSKNPFRIQSRAWHTNVISVVLIPKINVISSVERFNNTFRHVLQAHEEWWSACVKYQQVWWLEESCFDSLRWMTDTVFYSADSFISCVHVYVCVCLCVCMCVCERVMKSDAARG